MFKAIKRIISSLALVLSGSVISLLAAIGIVLCGVTAGAIVLLCGIALCVAVATIPVKRIREAIDVIIEELT